MPLVQGVLTAFLSLLCVSCLAPQNTAMVAVDMRGWSEPATILFENTLGKGKALTATEI